MRLATTDRIVEVVNLARANGVTVTEPFTGLERFDGAVTVLGPTLPYYEAVLSEAVAEATAGSTTLSASASGKCNADQGRQTSQADARDVPVRNTRRCRRHERRNNMSVITLLNVDGHRMLLTGDAGISALDQAIDAYEWVIGGTIADVPLGLFRRPITAVGITSAPDPRPHPRTHR